MLAQDKNETNSLQLSSEGVESLVCTFNVSPLTQIIQKNSIITYKFIYPSKGVKPF